MLLSYVLLDTDKLKNNQKDKEQVSGIENNNGSKKYNDLPNFKDTSFEQELVKMLRGPFTQDNSNYLLLDNENKSNIYKGMDDKQTIDLDSNSDNDVFNNSSTLQNPIFLNPYNNLNNLDNINQFDNINQKCSTNSNISSTENKKVCINKLKICSNESNLNVINKEQLNYYGLSQSQVKSDSNSDQSNKNCAITDKELDQKILLNQNIILKNYQNFTDKELIEHSLILINDQQACKFLQEKLTNNKLLAYEIYKFLKSKLIDLMFGVFSNYFVQKLIDNLPDNLLKEIILDIKSSNKFLSICLDPHGTRVMQRLLEKTYNNTKIKHIFTKLLMKNIHKLFFSSNGCHLVILFIELIKYPKNKSIYKYLQRNMKKICKDKNTCSAIQKIIEISNQTQQKKIYMKIASLSNELINDIFGNYVLQFIIKICNMDEVKEKIIDTFIQSLVLYCNSKYASNVIEKCIIYSEKDLLCKILKSFTKKIVHNIIINNFGNYVLQTVLAYAIEPYLSKILTYVSNYKFESIDYKYAKKVIKKTINGYIKMKTKIIEKLPENTQENDKLLDNNGLMKQMNNAIGNENLNQENTTNSNLNNLEINIKRNDSINTCDNAIKNENNEPYNDKFIKFDTNKSKSKIRKNKKEIKVDHNINFNLLTNSNTNEENEENDINLNFNIRNSSFMTNEKSENNNFFEFNNYLISNNCQNRNLNINNYKCVNNMINSINHNNLICKMNTNDAKINSYNIYSMNDFNDKEHLSSFKKCNYNEMNCYKAPSMNINISINNYYNQSYSTFTRDMRKNNK